MRYLVLIIACSFLIACNGKEKKHLNSLNKQKRTVEEEELLSNKEESNDPIELNSYAVELMQKSQSKFIDEDKKDSLLGQALSVLNKVISQDSSLNIAYINKAKVLRNLNRMDESIKVLENLVSKNEYAEALFGLGLSYEKIGKKDKASNYYNRALKSYELKLNSSVRAPMDEVNWIYVLLFVEGKNKVLDKINGQKKKEMNNLDSEFVKDIVESFNRENFIANF